MRIGRQKVVHAVLSGADFQSTVVRSLRDEKKINHLGRLALIVDLQLYIFFGSANQVLRLMKQLMAKREKVPYAERVQFIIFNFEKVEDIDYTGVSVFQEMLQGLRRHDGLHVLVFAAQFLTSFYSEVCTIHRNETARGEKIR